MTKERKEQIQFLLARYAEGKASADEEAQLLRFMEEEEQLTEWEPLIEEFMSAEPQLAEYDRKKWDPVAARILEKNKDVPTASKAKIRRMPWIKWAAAACILLIAGYVLWNTSIRKPEGVLKTEMAKTKDVAPPHGTRAVITLADGSVVYLDSAANGTLAQQNNVNLVKTADGKIIYNANSDQRTASSLVYNTLTNPRGSKVIDMQLSDGSHVWLNAGSSVKYPVAFAGNERTVEITGEAYFEVTHNASKPFHVKKGETDITVLGTHFNVNAYEDEDALRVTLLEGSVKVSQRTANSEQRSAILKPGQQAEVTRNAQLVTRNNIDLDEVMAWKNGLFHFNRASLPTIMRELARWYDLDVHYEGNIPVKEFGGEMQRDLPLSSVLRLLEKGGIHFRIEGKSLTVLP